MRAEGFVIELLAPDGQARFEYVMNELIRLLRALPLQELVEQIVRDPDGINRCRRCSIRLEIFLNAFENPKV